MLRYKLYWLLSKIKQKFFAFSSQETDALYRILYDQYHNLDKACETHCSDTANAFSKQWQEYPEGEYLLSDPWFKQHVTDILSSQEILLKKEWFKDKKVLDAGCGNGRWSYGLTQLGANVTCVDINQSALDATKKALAPNTAQFVQTKLEDLNQHIEPNSFDLGFSWGVLHHCVSFNQALKNVADTIKPGGYIYLYLYGRDSLPLHKDIQLFKKRVIYNFLLDDKQKYKFLLKEARGNSSNVHNVHDVYAPLINRRFTFAEVSEMLKQLGFNNIVRTINHTEVFVRAVKGDAYSANAFELSPHAGPYWFQNKSSLK